MLATVPSHPWPTDESLTADLTPAGLPRTAGRQASPTEFPTLRHSSHRQSMYSGIRRPLRSSPLAGPALQLDGSIPEVDEEKNLRPSRILSTPDLASLLPSSPQTRLRYTRPKTAESAQGFSHVSIPSTPGPGPLRRPVSLFAGEMPVSSPLLTSSTLRHPPSMGDNLRSPKLSPPPSVIRRPKTAHGYPTIPQSTPHNSNIPPSEQHIPQVHSRDPVDNSWFTTNTYEITPKFSRLGLASSSVVLPVSAKEHRKLSRQTSRSSVGTFVSTKTIRLGRADSALSLSSSPASDIIVPTTSQQHDTLHAPTTTTTSSLTRCSSSSSVSDSCGPASLFQTTTASVPTIAEGDEPDLARHQLDSQLKTHQRSTSPFITPPKKAPLLPQFKNLKKLRSIKSLTGSLRSSTSTSTSPINEKKSKLDANHGNEKIKLGLLLFPVPQPSSSDSSMSDLGEEESALGKGKGKRRTRLSKILDGSVEKKSSFGVRRLWKSIVSWQQQNRSS